jgi:hypothetical protein
MADRREGVAPGVDALGTAVPAEVVRLRIVDFQSNQLDRKVAQTFLALAFLGNGLI